MSSSSRRPFAFLDLPLELRFHIYQYCLVRNDSINVQYLYIDECRYTRDEKKSLLLVSKQVGSEASRVLYGDNVFKVLLHEGGAFYLTKYFSKANRQQIRKLQIVMQPQGISYGRMPNSAVWSPILAGLTKLSIVAQQPLPVRKYFDAWMYFDAVLFEQDMEEWMVWLRPIIKYIARRLPKSCTVEVDDDDRSETSALMSECFPKGYRKAKTLAGDVCFGRNDLSEKSRQ